MRNSKLYKSLQELAKIEQNRFRKYLQSPYFNANETHLALYECIIGEINDPSNCEWTKQQIWEALGLEDHYDDIRLRKYFSDLLKLLENFFAQQKFEESEIIRNTALLDAVQKRKQSNLYNSSLKRSKGYFEKSLYRNSEYYYGKYLLEKSIYGLADFEHNRTVKSNWEEISRNLDYFFIAEKLYIYCNVLARRDLAVHEYDLGLMEEIENFVKQHQLSDIPPIAIYFQVLNLYRNPDDVQSYRQFKQLLDRYSMNFPQEEAGDLYSLAQNYCIQQLNRGRPEFLSELFVLYKNVLEKRIIIRDNELSPWDFRNIVVVSLRVGDYGWTLKFIDDYLQFLPEDKRENARTFNLAQVYFYQRRYTEVVELLRFVEYDDITYNLNSKDMLLRVYYETDEWDPLYSLFESFRTYLNRNKDIQERQKQAYKNLIRFTRKLTRLHEGDLTTISKLREEISATPNVANQKWLLEKLEEFN